MNGLASAFETSAKIMRDCLPDRKKARHELFKRWMEARAINSKQDEPNQYTSDYERGFKEAFYA